MMELWIYLSQKKRDDPTMTNRKFAKVLGVTPVTLSRILNYKQLPSVDLAKKIEQETDGQVVWHVLLEMCNNKKRQGT